ncbi:hypothetical protein BB560_007332, partial [Smittium megazygosporum]
MRAQNGSTSPVQDTGSKMSLSSGKHPDIQTPKNDPSSTTSSIRHNSSPRPFQSMSSHPSFSRSTSPNSSSFVSNTSQNDFFFANQGSIKKHFREMNNNSPPSRSENAFGMPSDPSIISGFSSANPKSRLGAPNSERSPPDSPPYIRSDLTAISPTQKKKEFKSKSEIEDALYEDYGFREYKPKKFRKFLNHFNMKILGFCIIILLVLGIFIGLPVGLTLKKNKSKVIRSTNDLKLEALAKKYSSKGQPLVPNVLPVDSDTPASAMSFLSSTKETFKLVFSDEFNKAGRTFGPGEDPFWEAQEFYYWVTSDLEYYHPDQITTSNGYLNITFIRKTTKPGLEFTSGMLNSWNKFCFQGGYIETRVSLPDGGGVPGYWPAVWMLGNLGRAGFAASTDGLWPYSYNSCDDGVLVNQTNTYLSRLPGQRLNACVCSGDHPNPGVGRGASEIDIFEAGVDWSGESFLSMSTQAAPFDWQLMYNQNYTQLFNIVGPGGVGSIKANSYKGGFFQQSISAVYNSDPEAVGGRKFVVYGTEYVPGPNGYVIWYVNGAPVYKVDAKAIGPNPFSKVSQRVISEEPMYIILNL